MLTTTGEEVAIMLTDRKKKILQIVIEDYIATAEPVGSRTIARKYDLGISPATIRNEMSDLELLGFLEQPHTSAGRVPSAQAYRFYVDSMISPGALTDNDRALIDGWYRERVRSIDDIFQSTAKILSRMSKNVSMFLTNRDSSSAFSYMRFLPLNSQKAILCLITDDGNIDNCVVEVPLGMKQEEMDYLAQRISNKLHGMKLSDIKETMLEELYVDLSGDKMLFTSLLKAVQQMSAGQQEQKMFLGGTKQLFNQPEFRDAERIKDLLGVLEEEKVLKDMLNAGTDSGLRITIGSENKFTSIQDCSMIQATYRLNGQVVGTMAVLGPTRMEYCKVISVMDYLHNYLQVVFDKAKT